MSQSENYQRGVNVPILGLITLRNMSLAASLAFGVLGIGLTAVSIFLTLREPETRVTFEIISATDVLDLRRSLKDLRIEFRGQDLQEQDLNLKVVKINVANAGETHIRAGDYSNIDWGIKVVGGQVIEAKVDRSNAANVISTNDLRYIGSDTIGFPKIVFDKRDAFAIELLLLHPNDAEPDIVPIGKIAGVENFDLVPPPLPGQEVGFVGQAFGGSFRVLAVRSGVYFVGSIIILFASVFGLVGGAVMLDSVKARRRRKRVLRTKAIKQIDRVSIRDGLIDLYGSTGLSGLRRLSDIIAEPSAISWMNHSSGWLMMDRHRGIDDDTAPPMFDDSAGDLKVFWRARDALLTMGVLERGGHDEVIVDPALTSAVKDLVAELEN